MRGLRYGPADLPEVIPVFPLPGALLLPRAPLPLHIFEPRYLAMIDDCLASSSRLIGMISTRGLPPGAPDAEPPLAAIGCAGRLTRFAETEDGRCMITLTGVSRFRLGAEVEGFTPWRRFEVSWDGFDRDLGKAEEDPGLDRPGFMSLLARFFAARELSADLAGLEHAPPEMLINAISALLPLEPEERQALLEAPDLANRRETLVTLMEFALRGGTGEDILQ